ncbi:MAG TPA: HAD-IIIA family hydrolase [Micromonosporaceae bacterium]
MWPRRDGQQPEVTLVEAVLFDRDGTLVRDVPYNGDPTAVEPMPGARAALDRLRRAGLRLGVVTNQSGVARGILTPTQVDAVNARIERILGPFDTWQVCPHDDADRCGCRKPAPGLIQAAAEALGTHPSRCVVVGDIGRDMAAAGAAGSVGLLVPTDVTRLEEVAAAPAVAPTLGAAVDWILARQRLHVPPKIRHGRHVLAVRTDSAGDVLLTGPAIRALAATASRVTMICGPRGYGAARLLPGVDELVEWRTPWIDPTPGQVVPSEVYGLIDTVAALGVDEAVVFTSFHQSPLPFALMLRLAGVQRISAISPDYPGALLDIRHRLPDGLPEPERALSLAAAAGYRLPAGDDGRLRVVLPERDAEPAGGFVVVHPGASVPARACPPERSRRIVQAIAASGRQVLVTGGPQERELTRYVAGDIARDLGGRTPLDELAGLLSRASCLVSGNTGPAHLAAAVGTPVVSLFAPTVPFGQWGPYRVPHVRLGDPLAACRDSRATTCPVPGHPCLSTVDPERVVAAVELLERRSS